MRDRLATAFICITSLLIKYTQTYVLLAANLDDFKSIAKKLVPDKLAQQLTDIAATSAFNLDDENNGNEGNEDEIIQTTEMPHDRAKDEPSNVMMYKVRNSNYKFENAPEVLNISFDELVKKVKKRIEDELMKSKPDQDAEDKTYDYVHDQSNAPDELAEDQRGVANSNVNINEHVKAENVIPEYGSKDDVNSNEKTALVENSDTERLYKVKRPKKYVDSERPQEFEHRERLNEYETNKRNEFYENRDRPEEYENRDRPNDYEDRERPKEYEDREKPKEYEGRERPKDYEDRERPKEGEDWERPNEYEDRQRPNEYDNRKKPKDHEDRQRPKDFEERERPKKYEDRGHQEYEDRGRPKEKSPKTYNVKIREKEIENDSHRPDTATQAEEEDNILPYAKLIMHQNDSYEDYVTPAREEYVFASDERIPAPNLKPTKPSDIKVIPFAKTTEDEKELKGYESEDIKAQTADLWYDYNDGKFTSTTPGDPKYYVSKKPRKPTVIPKRDFYKISSPNYIDKIPVVAEKYDFNEPIPEKDREPEHFKPIRGLVPLTVNKKVKFSHT